MVTQEKKWNKINSGQRTTWANRQGSKLNK